MDLKMLDSLTVISCPSKKVLCFFTFFIFIHLLIYNIFLVFSLMVYTLSSARRLTQK